MHSNRSALLAALALVVLPLVACSSDDDAATPAGAGGTGGTSAPLVRSGAGPDAASIQAVVDQYRADLGDLNPNEPTALPGGRREINWDGVSDEMAAPNFLPPDFFNATEAPRARGVKLETTGEGVQASADADNPSGTLPRFGNINASYPDSFKTFSGERLFSPVGSNVVDLTFYVPGTTQKAVVRGFGAVYTDADKLESTSFEYFDAEDRSLGKFPIPASNDGLSFLGVSFEKPVVHRVRIAYGQVALGPDDGPDNDVAVMDDFIFGEPHAIE
jgi:hypothetical protein